MNKHLFFAGCAVAALAIAAGCGGAGSQGTPPTQQSLSGQSQSNGSGTAQGTVRLTIPAKSSSSSSARSPEYISANTQSFTVQVGTGVPVLTTVSGSSCTALEGGGYTCTANFTGVVGDNAVTIAAYASTNGTGTPLSKATTTVTLTSGTNSPVSMTLNPVVATQVLVITSPSPASITADGSSQTVALAYSLQDSTGATVIATEGTLIDSNGNPLPTATPSVSVSPSAGVTINAYTGDAAGGTLSATLDTTQVTSNVKFTAPALAGTNVKAASATLTVVVPSPSPSSSASSAPTDLIVNGNFSDGLTGWTACSFARTALSAPVDPSPTPKSISAQTTNTSAITSPTAPPVATPLPNLNPDVSPSPIPAGVGSNVVLTGDPAMETKGASGICQSVAIPSDVDSAQLTFWVYEAGGEYEFKYNDQEADVLDSTGITVKQVLFTDLNCFQYPASEGGIFATQMPATTSGCWPSAYGGDSHGYDDWQGGYWVPRGPFDLSAYAGSTVTLFFGVWDESASITGEYGNAMYVGGVQLLTSDCPTSSERRSAAGGRRGKTGC